MPYTEARQKAKVAPRRPQRVSEPRATSALRTDSSERGSEIDFRLVGKDDPHYLELERRDWA